MYGCLVLSQRLGEVSMVRILIVFLFFALTQLGLADINTNPKGFINFIAQLKRQLHRDGYSKPFLNKAFANVHYIHRTIFKDKHQPEIKLTLQGYLKHMMVPGRIRAGYAYMQEHRALLQRVEQRYHVGAQYVVALLGLESSYGRVTGQYPEVSTLATLIYDGHRSHYFYKELNYALKIVQRGDANFSDLKGSWAGAMGQPQFMPTHYYDYAVDFDGKGKKDIWHNTADVLGSIAYSLHRYGWQYKKPVAIEAHLTKPIPKNMLGLNVEHTAAYWLKRGVKPVTSVKKLMAEKTSLLEIGGKDFLVFKNFEILHHWNRSKFYVMAVRELAKMISMSPTQYQTWLHQQLKK